ncbi:hypothetical protein CCACVL1_28194, partial [Corchorus capsularis]
DEMPPHSSQKNAQKGRLSDNKHKSTAPFQLMLCQLVLSCP